MLMNICSTQKLLCLLLFCLAAAGACKKSGPSAAVQSSGGFSDSLALAITPVGSPVGTPISKTIGAGGGTLVSADGVVELVIPAGALTANTNIGIQPVTNTMPDSAGLGLAYDLLPNGTKFNVPVTITFHYTKDEVPDNDADFLTIAYQDSSGAWRGDLKQRDFDTSAKTVSLDVSHFTEFGLDDGIRVNANPTVLMSGQVSYLVAYENLQTAGGITENAIIPTSILGDWTVDGIPFGNKQVGTITPTSLSASIYHAPAVSQITIFTIAVTFKIHEMIYEKNKLVEDYSDFVRAVNITVYPMKYNFTVSLIEVDSVSICSSYNLLASDKVPVYTDQSTFDLLIKTTTSGLQATASNFRNQRPSVSPPSVILNNSRYEWIPDTVGVLNVTGVFMDIYPEMPDDSILNFTLTNNAINVGTKVTDLSTGVAATTPPLPYTDKTGALNYFLLDMTQVPPYTSGDKTGAPAYLYLHVVQKQ